MAEEKSARRTAPKRGKQPSDGEQPPRRRRSGAQLALSARQQLAEITGMEAEAVTALERTEDGAWIVTVDVLELSRIPSTDDMLGSYEVELDDDGELLGYRRVRRYTRSQADRDDRGSA